MNYRFVSVLLCCNLICILLLLYILGSPSGPFGYVLFRISIKYGIITDNKTALQWCVGPDRLTNYYGAENWVDNLGGDWRMPTGTELQGLYDAGIKDDDWGCFENSGSFVWQGEVRDSSSRRLFAFDRGGTEDWGDRVISYFYVRAFAVRSLIR